MQDVEILLSLAEIAGVFIGFAALIAVRSGSANGGAPDGASGGSSRTVAS